MTTEKKTRQIEFSGTIVEMYKGSNSQFAKILLHPAYMDVPIQGINDFHLGESISVLMDYIIMKSGPLNVNNDDDM